MSIHYVAGFCFTPDRRHVALVWKNRPKWQAGKLNGIGGKVEPEETAIEAMEREFREEAGIRVTGWRHFCSLGADTDRHAELPTGWRVEFFVAFDAMEGFRTVTDEKVQLVPVNAVPALPHLPNLDWLIPMALSADGLTAQVIETAHSRLDTSDAIPTR